MSMRNEAIINDAIYEKLNKLRSLDKLVDISKSTIQFDILMALGEKWMSTSDITRHIGQRRKATTDALRKMKNKRLIEVASQDRETVYKLGELGERCYRDLMELLGITLPDMRTRLDNMNGDKHRSREVGESVLDLHKGRSDLALTNIVSEMVLALGTTKGNAMYLKDLARIVNLSEQRAESYIKLYLDGEHKLFRKITNEQICVKDSLKGGIGQKSKNGVMYGLTKEGLQYFYKMPIYSRLRSSLAYNFLSKITLTSHPRNIYRRLALLTYTGGVAALAAMILPFGFILTGLWLFLTTIIGTFMASGSTC